MSEEINFEELESDFSSEQAVEEQQLDESVVTDSEEVVPGQLSGYKYLKNPEVGESIILEIGKIEKKSSRKLKNSTDGSEFETGLLNKRTGKRTEFNLITTSNECLNITSWGLWFSLFGSNSLVEKKAVEKGSYKGIKVKITHNFNGQDSKAKASDLMKLRDFKTIEEAEAHKKKVAEAVKTGKVYSVELVD
jgi:hypothetical protein